MILAYRCERCGYFYQRREAEEGEQVTEIKIICSKCKEKEEEQHEELVE